MLVIMNDNAPPDQVQTLADLLTNKGFTVRTIPGHSAPLLGISGTLPPNDRVRLGDQPGVADIIDVNEPFQLAGRSFHGNDTVIEAGGICIGGCDVPVMAGPCSVESEEQIHTIAPLVRKAGASILRGGAYKPRTSPYSFTGLGEPGLHFLREAADENGMAAVSEVMDTSTLDTVCRYVDILQIGARNMQHFTLLKAVGGTGKPVLLKRGMSATVEDLLMSAEHIMAHGNSRVILCERGIRTFEQYTRNTMDISAVPVVKEKSHLPIIVDPSHGTGQRSKVAPMARAAVAAGADGLMIEVHNHPEAALSDGPQSLLPEQFSTLMQELKMTAWAIGRRVAGDTR